MAEHSVHSADESTNPNHLVLPSLGNPSAAHPSLLELKERKPIEEEHFEIRVRPEDTANEVGNITTPAKDVKPSTSIDEGYPVGMKRGDSRIASEREIKTSEHSNSLTGGIAASQNFTLSIDKNHASSARIGNIAGKENYCLCCHCINKQDDEENQGGTTGVGINPKPIKKPFYGFRHPPQLGM
ncbi:hypothetical protein GYMLUDRAFT_600521 [Collybiopsis luxurians FD-317 M1]|uniref:Uncharacterized protein n=1 Tax=Collybiopsis luxurians FD-317 M1 TaxID=944289 RepID=A0A0D0BY80_9AGAR|nr:hypothetical protein GYMLUDRAFT_600521 [Collybiopsis luxurians FD-317 M1]